MGSDQRDNGELVLAVFAAVERRDPRRFTGLVQPDFEIHWPRSLPYGGSYRDLDAEAQRGRPTWAATWDPLQPTAAERRMDPRIVADNQQTGEVLGLYQIRDGRLARAQMFHFDTVALARFLEHAR
jgi:ketosteroid isomerase-like protein